MKSLIINQIDKQAIESILTNIAAQYDIDGITAVDISLNKTAGIIQFNNPDRLVEAGTIDMILNLVAKGGPIIKQLPAYIKKIPGLAEQIASKLPGYSKAIQQEVQGVLPGMGEVIKGTAKGAPGALSKLTGLAKKHPVVTTGLAGAAAGKALGDTGGAVAGGATGLAGAAGIAGAAGVVKAAIPYALTALSFLPGLGIAATIAGAAYALGSDPEVDDVVGKWVDLETQKSPVSPEVKKQYVDTTLAAIQTGATTLAKQWKADYEKKQGKQPTASTIDELLKIAAPTTVKDTGDTVTTMEETGGTTEPATKGVLDSIMEFGSEVVDNAVYKLESLWGGQSAIDLQTKIADLLISKKQLAPELKAQFIGYLSEFAKQGFSDIKQESAKKKEEEKATGGAATTEKKTTDQTTPTGKTDITKSTEVGKPYQLSKRDMADPNVKKRVEDAVKAESAVKQPGIPQALTSNVPGRETAPPYKLTKEELAADPELAQRVQNEAARLRQQEQSANTGGQAGPTDDATLQKELEQHKQDFNRLKQQAYNEERDKYGFDLGSLATAVLEYGPGVYKVYKALKEIISDGTSDDITEGDDIVEAITNDIIKEGGFFDTAERVLDVANKVLTESPEANRIVHELIGKTGKNPEEIFKAISNIAEAMLKVMDTVKENKSIEKKSSVDSIEYLQVNSGTFIIKRGSTYYNELEGILNKFAEEHAINNVAEIKLELSNDSGEVTFKKAEFSVMRGLAELALSNIIPGEAGEGIGTKLIDAAAAAFTNSGYILAHNLVRGLGGGTTAQAIAGAGGAYIWDRIFDEGLSAEEEKAKQVSLTESYNKSMEDPAMRTSVENYANEHGMSKEQAWLYLMEQVMKQM